MSGDITDFDPAKKKRRRMVSTGMEIPNKGERFGGRVAGTPNKSTVIKLSMAAQGIEIAYRYGVLPLEIMLSRMTGLPLPNGHHPTDPQVEIAIAAAPYIHPRLQAISYQERKPPSRIDASVLTKEQRRVLLEALRAGFIKPAALEGGRETIEGETPDET